MPTSLCKNGAEKTLQRFARMWRCTDPTGFGLRLSFLPLLFRTCLAGLRAPRKFCWSAICQCIGCESAKPKPAEKTAAVQDAGARSKGLELAKLSKAVTNDQKSVFICVHPWLNAPDENRSFAHRDESPAPAVWHRHRQEPVRADGGNSVWGVPANDRSRAERNGSRRASSRHQRFGNSA